MTRKLLVEGYRPSGRVVLAVGSSDPDVALNGFQPQEQTVAGRQAPPPPPKATSAVTKPKQD